MHAKGKENAVLKLLVLRVTDGTIFAGVGLCCEVVLRQRLVPQFRQASEERRVEMSARAGGVLVLLCLLSQAAFHVSARGVLSIKLLNFENRKGRTYEGHCCDPTPEDGATCRDQCDYVMRLIISGLGRANDHVFLFHRPLKYDSNDLLFQDHDRDLTLTVLFDKWPEEGHVKMNAFFYDYDDFDHTTSLVDWFETELSGTGTANNNELVVSGNRQADKTRLQFQWSWYCDPGSPEGPDQSEGQGDKNCKGHHRPPHDLQFWPQDDPGDAEESSEERTPSQANQRVYYQKERRRQGGGGGTLLKSPFTPFSTTRHRVDEEKAKEVTSDQLLDIRQHTVTSSAAAANPLMERSSKTAGSSLAKNNITEHGGRNKPKHSFSKNVDKTKRLGNTSQKTNLKRSPFKQFQRDNDVYYKNIPRGFIKTSLHHIDFAREDPGKDSESSGSLRSPFHKLYKLRRTPDVPKSKAITAAAARTRDSASTTDTHMLHVTTLGPGVHKQGIDKKKRSRAKTQSDREHRNTQHRKHSQRKKTDIRGRKKKRKPANTEKDILGQIPRDQRVTTAIYVAANYPRTQEVGKNGKHGASSSNAASNRRSRPTSETQVFGRNNASASANTTTADWIMTAKDSSMITRKTRPQAEMTSQPVKLNSPKTGTPEQRTSQAPESLPSETPSYHSSTPEASGSEEASHGKRPAYTDPTTPSDTPHHGKSNPKTRLGSSAVADTLLIRPNNGSRWNTVSTEITHSTTQTTLARSSATSTSTRTARREGWGPLHKNRFITWIPATPAANWDQNSLLRVKNSDSNDPSQGLIKSQQQSTRLTKSKQPSLGHNKRKRPSPGHVTYKQSSPEHTSKRPSSQGHTKRKQKSSSRNLNNLPPGAKDNRLSMETKSNSNTTRQQPARHDVGNTSFEIRKKQLLPRQISGDKLPGHRYKNKAGQSKKQNPFPRHLQRNYAPAVRTNHPAVTGTVVESSPAASEVLVSEVRSEEPNPGLSRHHTTQSSTIQPLFSHHRKKSAVIRSHQESGNAKLHQSAQKTKSKAVPKTHDEDLISRGKNSRGLDVKGGAINSVAAANPTNPILFHRIQKKLVKMQKTRRLNSEIGQGRRGSRKTMIPRASERNEVRDSIGTKTRKRGDSGTAPPEALPTGDAVNDSNRVTEIATTVSVSSKGTKQRQSTDQNKTNHRVDAPNMRQNGGANDVNTDSIGLDLKTSTQASWESTELRSSKIDKIATFNPHVRTVASSTHRPLSKITGRTNKVSPATRNRPTGGVTANKKPYPEAKHDKAKQSPFAPLDPKSKKPFAGNKHSPNPNLTIISPAEVFHPTSTQSSTPSETSDRRSQLTGTAQKKISLGHTEDSTSPLHKYESAQNRTIQAAVGSDRKQGSNTHVPSYSNKKNPFSPKHGMIPKRNSSRPALQLGKSSDITSKGGIQKQNNKTRTDLNKSTQWFPPPSRKGSPFTPKQQNPVSTLPASKKTTDSPTTTGPIRASPSSEVTKDKLFSETPQTRQHVRENRPRLVNSNPFSENAAPSIRRQTITSTLSSRHEQSNENEAKFQQKETIQEATTTIHSLLKPNSPEAQSAAYPSAAGSRNHRPGHEGITRPEDAFQSNSVREESMWRVRTQTFMTPTKIMGFVTDNPAYTRTTPPPPKPPFRHHDTPKDITTNGTKQTGLDSTIVNAKEKKYNLPVLSGNKSNNAGHEEIAVKEVVRQEKTEIKKKRQYRKDDVKASLEPLPSVFDMLDKSDQLSHRATVKVSNIGDQSSELPKESGDSITMNNIENNLNLDDKQSQLSPFSPKRQHVVRKPDQHMETETPKRNMKPLSDMHEILDNLMKQPFSKVGGGEKRTRPRVPLSTTTEPELSDFENVKAIQKVKKQMKRKHRNNSKFRKASQVVRVAFQQLARQRNRSTGFLHKNGVLKPKNVKSKKVVGKVSSSNEYDAESKNSKEKYLKENSPQQTHETKQNNEKLHVKEVSRTEKNRTRLVHPDTEIDPPLFESLDEHSEFPSSRTKITDGQNVVNDNSKHNGSFVIHDSNATPRSVKNYDSSSTPKSVEISGIKNKSGMKEQGATSWQNLALDKSLKNMLAEIEQINPAMEIDISRLPQNPFQKSRFGRKGGGPRSELDSGIPETFVKILREIETSKANNQARNPFLKTIPKVASAHQSSKSSAPSQTSRSDKAHGVKSSTDKTVRSKLLPQNPFTKTRLPTAAHAKHMPIELPEEVQQSTQRPSQPIFAEDTRGEASLVLRQPKGKRVSALYTSSKNGTVIHPRLLSKQRKTAAPTLTDTTEKRGSFRKSLSLSRKYNRSEVEIESATIISSATSKTLGESHEATDAPKRTDHSFVMTSPSTSRANKTALSQLLADSDHNHTSNMNGNKGAVITHTKLRKDGLPSSASPSFVPDTTKAVNLRGKSDVRFRKVSSKTRLPVSEVDEIKITTKSVTMATKIVRSPDSKRSTTTSATSTRQTHTTHRITSSFVGPFQHSSAPTKIPKTFRKGLVFSSTRLSSVGSRKFNDTKTSVKPLSGLTRLSNRARTSGHRFSSTTKIVTKLTTPPIRTSSNNSGNSRAILPTTPTNFGPKLLTTVVMSETSESSTPTKAIGSRNSGHNRGKTSTNSSHDTLFSHQSTRFPNTSRSETVTLQDTQSNLPASKQKQNSVNHTVPLATAKGKNATAVAEKSSTFTGTDIVSNDANKDIAFSKATDYKQHNATHAHEGTPTSLPTVTFINANKQKPNNSSFLKSTLLLDTASTTTDPRPFNSTTTLTQRSPTKTATPADTTTTSGIHVTTILQTLRSKIDSISTTIKNILYTNSSMNPSYTTQIITDVLDTKVQNRMTTASSTKKRTPAPPSVHRTDRKQSVQSSTVQTQNVARMLTTTEKNKFAPEAPKLDLNPLISLFTNLSHIITNTFANSRTEESELPPQNSKSPSKVRHVERNETTTHEPFSVSSTNAATLNVSQNVPLETKMNGSTVWSSEVRNTTKPSSNFQTTKTTASVVSEQTQTEVGQTTAQITSSTTNKLLNKPTVSPISTAGSSDIPRTENKTGILSSRETSMPPKLLLTLPAWVTFPNRFKDMLSKAKKLAESPVSTTGTTFLAPTSTKSSNLSSTKDVPPSTTDSTKGKSKNANKKMISSERASVPASKRPSSPKTPAAAATTVTATTATTTTTTTTTTAAAVSSKAKSKDIKKQKAAKKSFLDSVLINSLLPKEVLSRMKGREKKTKPNKTPKESDPAKSTHKNTASKAIITAGKGNAKPGGNAERSKILTTSETKQRPANTPFNTFPASRPRFRDIDWGPKVMVPKKGLYVPHVDDVSGNRSHHGRPQVSGTEAHGHVSMRVQQLSVRTVFSRYWPAILGLTVGTVFLVAALLTSIACRQQRLFVQRRQGWQQDTPQHLTEPPDTSEYSSSSSSSLASDNTRSSLHFT